MKNSILIYFLLITIVLLMISIKTIEGRGGRRGGSFGGVFGIWRKHKKTVSGGNSRRTTHGSQTYTTATKSRSSSSLSSSSKLIKSTKQTQGRSSYQKQQMPLNGGASGVGYNSYGFGSHLPPGGTFYTNTAALPPGAIYYAQPPIYSSSGTGNFIYGMAAGHMLSNTFFNHRPYVTHVYHQRSSQQLQSEGAKVIIENDATIRNSNTAISNSNGNIALPSFNTTIAQEDAHNTETNGTTSQDERHQLSPVSVNPKGGIICMPAIFNETDSNDSSKILHIEKVICYPAPPSTFASSASASHLQLGNKICFQRNVTEVDPNDHTKTIIKQREECVVPTTTQMPQVAGEIGENTFTEKIAKEVTNKK